MNNISAVVLVSLCAVLSVPFFASAHGEGASYEETVGNFLVDVGYSSPAPVSGESVVFDFKISAAESAPGIDTEFSNVWVRIESADTTVLATGVYNPAFGGPRLSYAFPKEGEYTVYARYENSQGPLAEVSFPMTVVPQSNGQKNQDMPWNFVYGAAGAVLGFLLAVIAGKYLRF